MTIDVDPKTILFIGLGVVLVVYAATLIRGGFIIPTVLQTAIGFVTAFFDTLGIGSFATTTAAYKLRSMVPVKLIPGALNVGHTLATIAQAFIFTKLVPVESKTLVPMIGAAVSGSWLGAGVVVRWPRRKIQIGMGLALLGIGLYGPCMILIYLLGMNPLAAFPIMMGSCAFLMPISSARFVAAQTYHRQAALGLALGGLPAAVIAGLYVGSMRLDYVRWLVVVVVVYTSITMLLTANAGQEGQVDPVTEREGVSRAREEQAGRVPEREGFSR